MACLSAVCVNHVAAHVVQPRLVRNGSELFYLAPDGTMMSSKPGGCCACEDPTRGIATSISASRACRRAYRFRRRRRSGTAVPPRLACAFTPDAGHPHPHYFEVVRTRHDDVPERRIPGRIARVPWRTGNRELGLTAPAVKGRALVAHAGDAREVRKRTLHAILQIGDVPRSGKTGGGIGTLMVSTPSGLKPVSARSNRSKLRTTRPPVVSNTSERATCATTMPRLMPGLGSDAAGYTGRASDRTE